MSERCTVWEGGRRCFMEVGHVGDHDFTRKLLPDGPGSGNSALGAAQDLRHCRECGSLLPHWRDPVAALRELAHCAPPGLRPLMLQAARELEELRAGDGVNEDAARYRALRKAWNSRCAGDLPPYGPVSRVPDFSEFDRLIDEWRKKYAL